MLQMLVHSLRSPREPCVPNYFSDAPVHVCHNDLDHEDPQDKSSGSTRGAFVSSNKQEEFAAVEHESKTSEMSSIFLMPDGAIMKNTMHAPR